jgi:FAD/FMN-containing dehydrogenase
MYIRNFGANVAFTPRHRYAPSDEHEVLEALERHAEDQIRVMGSLHSWSDCAVAEHVLLDLQHFDSVQTGRGADGSLWVDVGGGCGLRRMLAALRSAGDLTLPTIGAVLEQTVAGAIATATHGSGMSSMSHYVEEVRAAAYDPDSGAARVYTWRGGAELQAARCALGCMGAVLSVRLRCIPGYHVEETLTRRQSLEEVLEGEQDYPLQQFVLVPYLWSYLSFQRRRTQGPAHTRASTYLFRGFKWLGIDIAYHAMLKALLARADPRAIVRFYVGTFPRLLVLDRPAVDRSEKMLTLQHQYFRHVEIEIFIPAHALRPAVALIRTVIDLFAGTAGTAPREVAQDLERIGMLDALLTARGSYTHHYPVSFRRVLPDDTLISMTAGGEGAYYATSFFTYLGERHRGGFYRLAAFLAQSLTGLYGARLHWGKYYPLQHAQIAHLYPRLEEFRQLCSRVDPGGVFRNAYAARVLGFTPRTAR